MTTSTENNQPAGPAGLSEVERKLNQELTSARDELQRTRSDLNRTQTELKETRSELKDFQELFFGLSVTITDIVYRLDPEGRFTFVNEAVSRLGYHPDELFGKHFSEIIWPADVESVSRRKVLEESGRDPSQPRKPSRLFDERRSGDRRTTGLEVRLKTRSGPSQAGIVHGPGQESITAEVYSTGLHGIDPESESKLFLGTVGVIRDLTGPRRTEQKFLRQSAALEGFNRVIRSSLVGLAEEEVARACLTEAMNLTGSSFGFICEFDDRGEPVKVITDASWKSDAQEQLLLHPGLRQLIRSLAAEGTSRIFQSYPEADPPAETGSNSIPPPPFLVAPLRQKEQTVGLIGLAGKVGEYGSSDLHNVETMADAFVETLMRKKVEQKLARRVADLSALNAMANIANLSLNVEVIAKRALDEVRRLVYVPSCGIMLLDDRTGLLVLTAGRNLSRGFIQKGGRLRLGQGVPGNVARSGKPTIIGDVSKFDGPLPLFDGVKKIKSVASIPLLGPDGVIGVMCLGARQLDYFDQDAVDLLQALGRQVAIGVTKARFYEKQQDATTIIAAERSAKDTINAMGDGLVLVDTDGFITFVNPAFEALTGYGITELSGRKYTHIGKMLIAPEDLPTVETARQELNQGGIPAPLTLSGLTKAGKRIMTILTMSMIKDSKGSPTSLVMVVKDITAMMETLAEKERLEARLRQSEKLEALGTLAGGIAHDFNNLLTAIGGYAELIEAEAALGSFVRESAEVIRQQVRQAAKLIRQILDFSRTSPGTRHPLDLAAFLKEICKLLARTIPENIQIDLTIEPGDYILEADPVGLQQVLTNLAVNSRDAMPEGGRLDISLKRWTLDHDQVGPSSLMPPGDWLLLSVVDNGSGMPPEVLPHVFDPFFTTKEVGHGTGLGLAQVYGIVEQHGGYIDLKSEEGRGTSVAIYLPDRTGEAKLVPGLEDQPARPGHGEVIMLVEDDAQVLKLGTKMLQKMGYAVVTATDGLEALELYDRDPENIALVLTDMTMPNMSGRELIQALKYRNPNLKVLVWTGYYLDRDAADLQALGVADCLMKPPNYRDLATRIGNVLGGGSHDA
jgi:PAS domain S-box-containing protein